MTTPRSNPNRLVPFDLPTILRLPRELRDYIYEHYVRVDGGYTYDLGTNRLRQADGKPISYSLALTCRQIATELQGLALHFNPITFSTSFSEHLREEAGIFHATIRQITILKTSLLRYLSAQLFDSEMAQAAAAAYPQFAPIFDSWRSRGNLDVLIAQSFIDCGEAPSLWRDFIHYTLDLVSMHPAFVEEARSIRRFWSKVHGCQALELNNASPEPWVIPNAAERERLAIIARVEPKSPFYYSQTRYPYSAASVALRFLNSVSNATRAAIRHVILLEDRESVAHSECHGRGFIALCQQNQKLRVERSVSLWRNMFPVSHGRTLTYVHNSEGRFESSVLEYDRLSADSVTKSVGAWIAEARALPSLGMPEGAFTLILDGNPTPEHTSEVFRVVQRDAAWQTALDTCYSRGFLPQPSWLERRLRAGYMYEGLPDVVRNLRAPDSLVRCNFDPGSPYDIETLLEERRGWSLQDWEQSWKTHAPQKFQTAPPLPPWHILRWQHVIF